MTAVDGFTLSVDQPCFLTAARKSSGGLQLGAAGICAMALQLSVSVNRKYSGTGAEINTGGATVIRLVLPDGDYAGQTVRGSFLPVK
ncbi:MAG TPA: hypothetical protein DC049_13465 [Spirochaetia bacterium]|nr:hypothetical protein [Spirochaetia bacterium]